MDTLHLVIVEDEEAHLQLMKRAVSREFPQAEVHHFPEASSCLEAIDRLKPDLIIADYLMPGMNGLEFLEELRLKGKNTPVIMITGQGDENIAVTALKLGAADYLVKTPEFFKLLPGAINKVLREQRLADSLRDSEKRFRDLAHSARDWLWEIDAEGEFTYSNPAVELILGYSPDEVVGTSFERFPPDNAKQTNRQAAFSLMRQGKHISCFSSCVASKNGREVFLETSGVPVFDSAGRFAGYRGIDRDITRREAAEQALRMSEERFRSIYERSPIGIMLLNKRGMVVDANRASLDLLGMPGGVSLLNFNLFDDPCVSEGSLEMLSEGRTVRYETRFDFGKAGSPGFLRPPGSAAAHFDVQITPLVENQDIGGYLLQVQDITVRKRAEQALEISQRFLEAANRSAGLSDLIEDFAGLAKRFTGCSVAAIRILEEGCATLCEGCEYFDGRPRVPEGCPSAPGVCPCIDAVRGVTSSYSPLYTKSGSFYTNRTSSLPADFPGCRAAMAHSGACSLFAYESVALIPVRLGDSILGLIRMADPKKDMLSPHALEVLERAAMELGTAVQRLRSTAELRRAHDELEMRVKKRTLELVSANGKLLKEIEERIRAQEALSKSAEDLKLFAYSIMHDLKSPTIGIHGLTKLLYRQYADKLNEKGRNYCEQILRASEYCSVLVDQINTYIATKESPLNIEPVRLNDLLQTVMEEFSAGLGARRIRWIQPDCDVEIGVDRLSMIRLFTNLVDNSLKYGGDALSEIRIGYEEAGDFCILSVSDDGAGMNKEDCEAIFRPFQRTGNVAGIPGTGLGLNIVREIARRHGGTVEVDPGPERGMVFRIFIGRPL